MVGAKVSPRKAMAMGLDHSEPNRSAKADRMSTKPANNSKNIPLRRGGPNWGGYRGSHKGY